MKKFEWISEIEAAEMMGYKKEVFRRYVREGKLPGIINTKLNYKTYEYCKLSIDKYKEEHSSA
jgi:hypothetical protein